MKPPPEFDCRDCGRHIVECSGIVREPPALCAHCLALPGWFNDPALVQILDRDYVPRAAAP